MGNIRIDSLPPDRLLASKDCRLCTKRRIRCDRILPHCHKCTSRKLSCPGFDAFQLKWTLVATQKTGMTRLPLSTSENAPNGVVEAPTEAAVAAAPRPSIVDRLQELQPKSHIDSDSHEHVWRTPCPTTDYNLIQQYSSTSFCDKLLHYSHSTVIPRLTWLDSVDTPWRKAILPLTSRSVSLRLSLLSLAAAHLSVTSAPGSAQAIVAQRAYPALRNGTLRTLNHAISRAFSQRHHSHQSAADQYCDLGRHQWPI
ncbi:Zn(II)2Cys6 transcription factor domain-containing protein [Aspergillus homomorphus CBS 101889]|uniref:Zn(2)-C6 fungal-type domain-containing protein n=1 Tax=Aspergillus homomorphus (strain CBS 101889) TaxID=1450537 RepID=A0A395HN29_ASPHC|nr:hypothetical protein BO97DRAFT_192700 [Aspergillus homomorphus CBS 101889]RAL08823.1 hypothetical protein BO97DRAFT_192700 [Aspergillus homomorphus CBS 101889]